MYLTSPPIQRYRVSTPFPTTALSSLTMVSADMISPPLYVRLCITYYKHLQESSMRYKAWMGLNVTHFHFDKGQIKGPKVWWFRWFHLVDIVDIFDSRQNKSRHINVDPRLPHKNFLRWWFRTKFLVSSCFNSFVANCYTIEQINRCMIDCTSFWKPLSQCSK